MNVPTQELLRLLDAIECDMRTLEGRLTTIRARLYEGSGLKQAGIEMDGHPKRRQPSADAGEVQF